MIVQRASSRSPLPWRNGKGVQYEIVADGPLSEGPLSEGPLPDGPLPDGWTWRVSTADIEQDVPFSSYPGVHRDFCVAVGDGVLLTIDGVEHRCELGSVTNFEGEAEVTAALIGGTVRALNLMRVLDGPTESWRILRVGESATPVHVVVALAEGAIVRIAGETVRMAPLDALLECDGETVVVDSGIIAVF